jgi:hypothetical protein
MNAKTTYLLVEATTSLLEPTFKAIDQCVTESPGHAFEVFRPSIKKYNVFRPIVIERDVYRRLMNLFGEILACEADQGSAADPFATSDILKLVARRVERLLEGGGEPMEKISAKLDQASKEFQGLLN